jgi:multiple sugar transport system substrate-binding protein
MLNVECGSMPERSHIQHSTFNIQHSTFAFLLLLLLIAGCAARPNDNREHLEFWALGSEGELVAKLIPEFERRNPGIHVVIQQIPWNAAHEKLLTAYVGEATPDVTLMGNTWMPEFVAIRALDDLGAFAAASPVVKQGDYFPGIWATNVVGTTLYGIPWYVDTRVLFYRSDVLAAAGFPRGPRTWAEWREAMRRIRDRKLSRWGILIPTNEYEPMTVLALSAHSTLLTPDGTRGAFSQPEFADAFNFYAGFFRDGFAPRVSNSQIANLYQQFAQGDFAMYITGPWNVGEFRRRLPPEMQDKWATAPLPAHDASEPTGISMAGGGSLVVFRASKHKVAARKLIEFLSEPQQQVRFYELTGDLPARRSAWLSPVLANDKHFPAFRIQLEHVAPLPKVPEWEQIATAIYDRGEAAARGTVTPAVALRQLDTRADELLEKRRWMLTRPYVESFSPRRREVRHMLNVECSMLNVECGFQPERSHIQHSTFNIQHSTFALIRLTPVSVVKAFRTQKQP